MSLRRSVVVLLTVALVAAGGSVVAWTVRPHDRPVALAPLPKPVAHVAAARVVPKRDPAAPPDAVAVVATSPKLTVYTAPGGATVQTTLANPTEFGQTLVVLALDVTSVPGWDEVSTPIRPNGTKGWVRAADVTARQVPYQITIVQHLHQATLWQDGTKVKTYPVAIGRPATPSPDGLFFVNAVIDNRQGNQAYGPWVLGLSGFSDVYQTFNGGDAAIAMHGTDEDSTVGTTASHGCFRMHDADATELARTVGLGTPVYVSS